VKSDTITITTQHLAEELDKWELTNHGSIQEMAITSVSEWDDIESLKTAAEELKEEGVDFARALRARNAKRLKKL